MEGKPQDNIVTRKAVLYRRRHTLPAFVGWEVVGEPLEVVAEAGEHHPGVRDFQCLGLRVTESRVQGLGFLVQGLGVSGFMV